MKTIRALYRGFAAGVGALRRRKLAISGIAVLGVASVFLSIVLAQIYVDNVSDGIVFSNADIIPRTRVGLVLGCAKNTADGRRNLYFKHRIDAAAELFRSGKIDYLLVSGSNPTDDYDEATDMMAALISRGVPEERIQRDYAGFRTLDSVVRAKKVFGLQEVTIISQEFHVKRAICIARKAGIESQGYTAREVAFPYSTRTLVRERFARVKLLLDLYVLRTRPKFLGDPINIG